MLSFHFMATSSHEFRVPIQTNKNNIRPGYTRFNHVILHDKKQASHLVHSSKLSPNLCTQTMAVLSPKSTPSRMKLQGMQWLKKERKFSKIHVKFNHFPPILLTEKEGSSISTSLRKPPSPVRIVHWIGDYLITI